MYLQNTICKTKLEGNLAAVVCEAKRADLVRNQYTVPVEVGVVDLPEAGAQHATVVQNQPAEAQHELYTVDRGVGSGQHTDGGYNLAAADTYRR